MKQDSQEQLVRSYYNRNTRRFLQVARRSVTKAIHQPLFMSPGMSLDEALHTQHNSILKLFPDGDRILNVLDLGCGVGESMIYMDKHISHPCMFFGITLSDTQVTSSQKKIAEISAQDHIKVLQGSFQDIPLEIPQADIAYAIESFIHASSPELFFSQVASRLHPQAPLVIFDDILTRAPVTKEEFRIIDDLRTGWLANTLLTADDIAAIAKPHSLLLQTSEDFSGYLKLMRIQDMCIRLLAPLARPFKSYSQYCRFILGGDARQRGYCAGLLEYRMLVFRKSINH